MVEYPDGLKKVQVKTTKYKRPSGKYVVNLRTLSGRGNTSYKIGDYDILVVVDETGHTYEFDKEDIKHYKNSITLGVCPSG